MLVRKDQHHNRFSIMEKSPSRHGYHEVSRHLFGQLATCYGIIAIELSIGKKTIFVEAPYAGFQVRVFLVDFKKNPKMLYSVGTMNPKSNLPFSKHVIIDQARSIDFIHKNMCFLY